MGSGEIQPGLIDVQGGTGGPTPRGWERAPHEVEMVGAATAPLKCWPRRPRRGDAEGCVARPASPCTPVLWKFSPWAGRAHSLQPQLGQDGEKKQGGGGGRKEEKKGLFLPCPSTVQTSRGSSAQHPQCGGWEPPQDDQHGNPPRMTSTGLGTAPRPLPLGNNLGGGGNDAKQQPHSPSLGDMASH